MFVAVPLAKTSFGEVAQQPVSLHVSLVNKNTYNTPISRQAAWPSHVFYFLLPRRNVQFAETGASLEAV